MLATHSLSEFSEQNFLWTSDFTRQKNVNGPRNIHHPSVLSMEQLSDGAWHVSVVFRHCRVQPQRRWRLHGKVARNSSDIICIWDARDNCGGPWNPIVNASENGLVWHFDFAASVLAINSLWQPSANSRLLRESPILS